MDFYGGLLSPADEISERPSDHRRLSTVKELLFVGYDDAQVFWVCEYLHNLLERLRLENRYPVVRCRRTPLCCDHSVDLRREVELGVTW